MKSSIQDTRQKRSFILLFMIPILYTSLYPYRLSAQTFLKTASSHFLPPGDLDVGLKNTYLRNAMSYDYTTSSPVLITGPTLEFRLGLSQQAEFETQWDMIRTMKYGDSYTHDISDVSFFTKINFIPESRIPSFGMKIGTKLPNASDETHVGTDLTDAFIWAISGKQWDQLHVFSNLGVEIIGNPTGGQDDALSYGIATAYPLSQVIRGALEISGRYFHPNHPINQAALRVGGTLHLNSWQLALGVSAGLISQSETWGATFGVTKLFHVF